MHAEYLIIDDNGEGEKIKHVGKVVPDVGISVLPTALGVEAVGLGNASRLVVSADQVHTMRIS